jgi:hypothetical protein
MAFIQYELESSDRYVVIIDWKHPNIFEPSKFDQQSVVAMGIQNNKQSEKEQNNVSIIFECQVE